MARKRDHHILPPNKQTFQTYEMLLMPYYPMLFIALARNKNLRRNGRKKNSKRRAIPPNNPNRNA